MSLLHFTPSHQFVLTKSNLYKVYLRKKMYALHGVSIACSAIKQETVIKDLLRSPDLAKLILKHPPAHLI